MIARRTHKWIALLVALPALIWALSGLYMTAVPIDIIHGDHFIQTHPHRAIAAGALADPLAAARAVPDAQEVRLHWLMDRPTYIVTGAGGTQLLDARTGARLAAPDAAMVRKLADHWYTGEARLERLTLVHELPIEARGREPPLWRADFGGWNKPTLYFSPATGELLTRRHELWRVFDFLWMLHIIDFDERDDVNNWLLRGFSLATVLMALSGAWLLLYSFRRRRRKRG